MAKQSDASSKRQVKNPETFRERALKASSEDSKPSKKANIKKAVQPVSKVGSQAGKLFDRQPFKLLKRPLRLIGKVILPPYVRNSWRELRQVEWPSWRQSLRLTGAVVIFAIIFGLVVAGVDFVIDKAFRSIILK